jgi:hypothetical protein
VICRTIISRNIRFLPQSRLSTHPNCPEGQTASPQSETRIDTSARFREKLRVNIRRAYWRSVLLMPLFGKKLAAMPRRFRALALFGSLLLLEGCGYYPPSVASSEEVLRLDPSHVSLRVRALPDEAVPALESRKNLEMLFFSDGNAVMESRITDRGLCELSRLSLPRLRLLDLGYCRKISDRGISCLPALTGLRRLGLLGCPGVSGEGLRSLRRMDGLVELDLRGCEVTDADIYNLRRMQNLKWIQLGGCRKVTSDGVRRLQRQMPNTRVEKDEREWSFHQ